MRRLLALLLTVLATTAVAQTTGTANPADVVLAENKYAKLTLQDYQTELLRLAPDMRGAFGTDPKRVSALLDNLLLMKSLATIAREGGVDKEPETRRRLAMETDRLLAQVEVQRFETDAGAEFDKKADQNEQRARELYQVDRKKYEVPAQVLVSHILFDSGKRGDAAALEAAKETRAKLLAGADFAATAAAVSDDPGTKSVGGHLDWFGPGRMDPAFTQAAFALAKPGDISEPVKSAFGYHLIKLEDKRPAHERSFDEVKAQIIADMRAQYVANARDQKVAAVRRDPATKVNEAEIEKLVTHPPAAR